MPIDINAILAPFQAPTVMFWHRIIDVFEKLSKRISDRLDRVEPLERRTRSFPIVGFYNGAVQAAIGPSQYGALGDIRGPSATIGDVIHQEWLIPETLGVLQGMTGAIVASMTRFEHPTPEMFDINKGGRFVDVFGEIAVLTRAMIGDRATLHYFTDQLIAFKKASDALGGASESEPSSTGTGGSGLEKAVRYIAAALLVIPAFFGFLNATAKSTDLGIRVKLLDAFSGIEAKVFKLRADIIDFFAETLTDLGDQAVDFLIVANLFLIDNLEFYSKFLQIYVKKLFDALKGAADDLKKMLDKITTILVWVFNAIEALTAALLAEYMPSLATQAAANAAVQILGSTAPPVSIPKFPDVYPLIFGSAFPGFKTALGNLRDSTLSFVSDTLDQTSIALDDASAALGAAAGRVILPGTLARWRKTATWADEVARDVFGKQAAERRERLHPDPLAGAFDSAAAGNFLAIVDVIPRYIEGVIQWWRERRNKMLPTSPHIVADHAQLGRVCVKRMVFRAHDADMDDEKLLASLQQRMKQAVESAWLDGEIQWATSPKVKPCH